MAKRIRRVNRIVGRAIGAGALLLSSARLMAHPEWSPIRVNRYAKLALGEPGATHLVYTILYGDGPALTARKIADLDGNGRLDDRERALLGGRAATAVHAGLHITLDGVQLSLAPTATDVGLAGDAVAPAPFSVDLTYPIALSSGPHELVVDDRVEVPSEGDSEIAIEPAPPVALIAAHRGRSGQGVEHVFSFRGPRFSVLEDRTVTVRVAQSDARAKWLRRAPLWGGAVATMMAGLVVWRARRRR